MLMMDYNSQYTGSTMGSDTLSGSVSSRQPNRVRTVRLVRPNHGAIPPPGLRHGPNLGFSVRGGREHGTGFFVSQVELGSEAYRQGLRVGDQIIRVNGFTIDDAVHKEVIQLISNHTHLSLKVRSVGMIPVKDKKTDPLSWQIISDCNSSTRSSPQLSEKNHDVRISIMVAPRSKLGCGICKGPEWKPGIFIQFTKEGGIARDAGLRPGDQILYCNNVDFADISFNEAVNLMKSSRQLDLIVRKSAGSELFPGESSGYNSSASSVTGDQSPSWSESKRLSIVKEESLDLEDRLTNLERFKQKKWEKIEWDDIDCLNEDKFYKPTIINLSESGTTIKNNGTMEECQDVAVAICSEQHEMKTVVVEVHRTSNEDKKTDNKLCKSPSSSSFASIASRSSVQSAATSLSSAISLELQRRSEKNKNQNKPTIDEQLQMKKVLRNVDSDKQQQHNRLMDEFKKAHRKMFKPSSSSSSSSSSSTTTECDASSDDLEAAAVKDRANFQQKINERLTHFTGETLSTNSTPPPPPPLPANEEAAQVHQQQQQHGTLTKPTSTSGKQKAPPPPVPIKTSTLSYQQPPPCPTPDYDTLSLSSNTTLPRTKGHHQQQQQQQYQQPQPPSSSSQQQQQQQQQRSSQIIAESVEMESLDSFHMNNPCNNLAPKPPNTYFQLNGSVSTFKKPVSVTIGEYPNGTNRKLPNKFEFLQNGNQNEDAVGNKDSITTQFASELAQTLNRSNLRKRTDSMENLLNTDINNERNGSVRITLNNNNKTNQFENLTKAFENRVTINIQSAKENNAAINGILKNGNNGNQNLASSTASSHRPLVHQKSITFGEMPTVIQDQPLSCK